jgi:hypothetical protein
MTAKHRQHAQMLTCEACLPLLIEISRTHVKHPQLIFNLGPQSLAGHGPMFKQLLQLTAYCCCRLASLGSCHMTITKHFQLKD